MPVYEYNCVGCEESIEIKRSFSDPEHVPSCPKCGYSMIKVFGIPAVQFKGGGFYSTGEIGRAHV